MFSGCSQTDDNLGSPDPMIQEKAVAASACYATEYCKQKPDLIINHHLSNLYDSELIRRGHCMALGALPSSQLAGRLDDILPALIDCTMVKNPAEEKWAESRRDAVRAITNIVKTFGVVKGNDGELF